MKVRIKTWEELLKVGIVAVYRGGDDIMIHAPKGYHQTFVQNMREQCGTVHGVSNEYFELNGWGFEPWMYEVIDEEEMEIPVPEETDPNGLKPSDPGAKLDYGKPRCALVLGGFARALTEVSKVGTYGAQKYSVGGWSEVPDACTRYDDAQMRHMLKRHAGETHDPDTGLHHAAHEAWNALARLELMLREESE